MFDAGTPTDLSASELSEPEVSDLDLESGLEASDVTRSEEEWGDQNEDLVREWLVSAQHAAHDHEVAGYRNKASDMKWRLPAILIPLVMSPVAGSITPEIWPYINYVNAGVLATTAALTGVYSFFNFQQKTQEHFDFSARYGDLVTDIRAELSKPAHKRQQIDTFRLRVQMIYDRLNGTAPTLPADLVN